jgi:hypothetical protein
MPYSYTFQVYRFEKHLKGYLNLSQGTTFHLELDSTLQTKEDISNQVQLSEFIIDETLIKVGNDWVLLKPIDCVKT